MGIYLNPGDTSFQGSLRSKIYVDKSGLIAKTNDVICTEQKYVCVSRPRRFGKSMAANMLAAYYDAAEDTSELFDNLFIQNCPSYQKHKNKYDVIKINMQEFLSATHDIDEMLAILQKRVIKELKLKYPDYVDNEYLVFVMQDIFMHTNHPFVI